MKNKFILFLLPILAAAYFNLLPACSKHTAPPDPLPPATQEGKNTFGCYIDGKPWVAWIDPNILDPSLRKIDAAYDEPGVGLYDNYSLSLSARMVNATLYEYLKIGFQPLHKEGDFNLSNLEYPTIILRLDDPISVYEMDTTIAQTFKVTKLDTIKNICSGLFSFTLVSKDGIDTVKISDGRFDIKYQVW